MMKDLTHYPKLVSQTKFGEMFYKQKNNNIDWLRYVEQFELKPDQIWGGKKKSFYILETDEELKEVLVIEQNEESKQQEGKLLPKRFVIASLYVHYMTPKPECKDFEKFLNEYLAG